MQAACDREVYCQPVRHPSVFCSLQSEFLTVSHQFAAEHVERSAAIGCITIEDHADNEWFSIKVPRWQKHIPHLSATLTFAGQLDMKAQVEWMKDFVRQFDVKPKSLQLRHYIHPEDLAALSGRSRFQMVKHVRRFKQLATLAEQVDMKIYIVDFTNVDGVVSTSFGPMKYYFDFPSNPKPHMVYCAESKEFEKVEGDGRIV
jgi:hypothetical protein